MRRPILTILFLACCVCAGRLSAQELRDAQVNMNQKLWNAKAGYQESGQKLSGSSRMERAAPGDLPRKSILYSWVNNAWKYETNTLNTYDANGNLTELIIRDTVTNAYLYRLTNKYDANGQVTESFNWRYENGNWVETSGTKNEYLYDGNKRITQLVVNLYDTVTRTFEKLTVTDYVYGGDGKLTTQTQSNWTGTAWLLFERQLITKHFTKFSTNYSQWLNYTTQRLVGGQWADFLRYSGTETADSLVQTIEENDGGTWRLSQRIKVGQKPNGDIVTVVEQIVSGDLEPQLRTTVSSDADGLQTASITETWVNGQWKVTNAEKTIYTKDANKRVTEIIVQRLDTSTGQYVNDTRIVNSGFTPLAAIAENAVFNSQYKLYPNPARESVTLQPLEQQRIVSIRLYDGQGRQVQEQRPSGIQSQYMVTTGGLSAGLYVLQVQTEHGILNTRVAVQP